MQLDRPLQVITPTVDGDVLAALAHADLAFTGRGLHRLIGRHSADGVRRALDRLARQGIVDVVVARPAKLYRLNQAHLAAPHVIALAHLYEQFLDLLRERLAAWAVQPAYAALFGSAARHQMRPDSDIDLFIVRPGAIAADDDNWASQIRELAHEGSRWTGNDVRVLEFSEEEARSELGGSEPVLSDIRQHGIRLSGPANYLRRRLTPPGGRARHA